MTMYMHVTLYSYKIDGEMGFKVMMRKKDVVLLAILSGIVVMIVLIWMMTLERNPDFMKDWDKVNEQLKEAFRLSDEPAVTFPIDINTATVLELEALPQIG